MRFFHSTYHPSSMERGRSILTSYECVSVGQTLSKTSYSVRGLPTFPSDQLCKTSALISREPLSSCVAMATTTIPAFHSPSMTSWATRSLTCPRFQSDSRRCDSMKLPLTLGQRGAALDRCTQAGPQLQRHSGCQRLRSFAALSKKT